MNPSDILVVRGGMLRDPGVLHEMVLDNEDMGLAALSVFASAVEASESAEECLERICVESKIKHGKIQVSTLARLQTAGFDVQPDESNDQPVHHHHVVFSSPVSESQARSFVDAFDAPVPNPSRVNRTSS